jgi:cystathionine beta-lyase/cystathionine gamma-synthase
MRFNTKTIHAGQAPEETSGAVMPPIFQTSTYAQEEPGKHKGYEYARVSNPTRTALEKLLAGLENATDGIAFASGLAAIDALLKMLRPGDEVLAVNDLYGGSYRLFKRVFEPYGITFRFEDLRNGIKPFVSPQTKMVWIESPTNPLLNLVDIASISAEAKVLGILTVVDNTFASPYLQRPLDLGADVVVHSTTKYLGGHSDVIGGAVCTSRPDVIEAVRFQVKCTGAVPGPMDCYLVLRGVKTLAVRMQRACENARKIAAYLESHPKVGMVRYPGLASHPDHELAKKQMDDFGGMLSFTLKADTEANARRFMSSTHLFTLAESLGGVESLISHPASMTHASIPREQRYATGLSDSLIRISVGIEDVSDLIEDLDQAFSKVP